ncbi:MAG: cysteine peptidase family C39 domain-containing protein [Candidatus Sericytochromatia bacterium]|nr:cysteine peptidase family C39 domain-containing protein [Candidatus Sericytochromatia bacterium]
MGKIGASGTTTRTGPVGQSPTSDRGASPQTVSTSGKGTRDRIVRQAAHIPLPDHRQGDSNACGTTSLAMILSGLGHLTDRTAIDAKIRRLDIFTAPTLLRDHARSKGFSAELYNKGTVEELTNFLDRGIPCQVLIEPGDPGDLNLHWVVVNGYERDPATGKVTLNIQDPARGAYAMSAEDFQKKWDDLKLAHVPTGLDNLFLAVGPRSTVLPAGRIGGAAPGLALSTALATGFNAADAVRDGLRGAWNGGRKLASKVRSWFG